LSKVLVNAVTGDVDLCKSSCPTHRGLIVRVTISLPIPEVAVA